MTTRSSFRGPLRLLVLAPYPLDTAPNQRFRFEQYLPTFQSLGWRVAVRSLLTGREHALMARRGHVLAKASFIARGLVRRVADLAATRRYDTVLIVREAFPIGPAVIERLVRRLAHHVVFDFDDAIWLPAVSRENRIAAWLKHPMKTHGIVSLVDRVIAGNAYLADYARQSAREVVVIPTTIDTDAYQPPERPKRGSPVLGWSGSRTTSDYLDALAEPLRRVQSELGVDILTIGAPEWRAEGLRVEARPWSSSTEVALLRELDVGLMPLTDDPWSRGKCGLKALQYMAMRSVAIVSPIGVNNEIIRHGVNGLHAVTNEGWYAMIRKACTDADARQRLGDNARTTVEDRYSVHANAAHWVNALAGF